MVAAATCTPAHAEFLINIDGPNNTGSTGNATNGSVNTVTANSLVFGPTNALAVGAIPIQTAGQTFQQLAQLTVDALGGVPANQLGNLNDTFELTIRVSFTEEIVTPGTFPGAATFRTAATQTNSFVEIYYNALPGGASDPAKANPLTGTGYNDGQLILRAVPSGALPSNGGFGLTTAGTPPAPVIGNLDQNPPPPNTVNNYPGISSVSGSGSAVFTSLVTAVDPAFFPDMVPGVSTLTFDVLTRTPYDRVDPSALFGIAPNTGGIGTAGPNPTVSLSRVGTVNGSPTGGGDSFAFQTSGNATVAVPEPASLMLTVLGLVGTFGFGWRRQRLAGRWQDDGQTH